MARKLRRYLAIIAANVVALFLILTACESWLTFEERHQWERFGKNISNESEWYSWGHKILRNRFNYRELDFEVPKPPGIKRIMVLGDSFTWGAGVAVEDRYTNRLEKLLAKDSRTAVEVLNFGIPGGPTVRELAVLKKYVDLVSPDRIVVGFCLNDPQPRAQNYSVERAKLGAYIDPICAAIGSAGFSRSGKLICGTLYELAEKSGALPDWIASLDRTYQKDSEEWQSFVAALREIKQLSDARSLPAPILTVLNQGSTARGISTYEDPDPVLKVYLRWYDQVIEAGRSLGFVAYDHREEIARELVGQTLAINDVDGHPAVSLHRIYAEKLFNTLTRVER